MLKILHPMLVAVCLLMVLFPPWKFEIIRSLGDGSYSYSYSYSAPVHEGYRFAIRSVSGFPKEVLPRGETFQLSSINYALLTGQLFLSLCLWISLAWILGSRSSPSMIFLKGIAIVCFASVGLFLVLMAFERTGQG